MNKLINEAKELLEDESTETIVKLNSMMESGEMNRAYNHLDKFNTANLISSAYDLLTMVDRLAKQLEAQSEWISVEDGMPKIGEPAICFNKEWIDLDFNGKGIREGFCYSDGTEWATAKWIGGIDQYRADYKLPTHWQAMPEPPKEGE